MDKSFTLVLAGLTVSAAGLWLTRPKRLLDFEFARQRRRAGARVARVALPDGEVSYLHSGTASGTPILHIHGFTGMKENWLPLMAALGRQVRQYAPDLPGWGESERREGADPGYAAQAERLAGFIDAVIGAPVDLVGHSMGGGIAAVLAARHPDKVRRLVLMSAAGVRFEDNAFGQAGWTATTRLASPTWTICGATSRWCSSARPGCRAGWRAGWCVGASPMRRSSRRCWRASGAAKKLSCPSARPRTSGCRPSCCGAATTR